MVQKTISSLEHGKMIIVWLQKFETFQNWCSPLPNREQPHITRAPTGTQVNIYHQKLWDWLIVHLMKQNWMHSICNTCITKLRKGTEMMYIIIFTCNRDKDKSFPYLTNCPRHVASSSSSSTTSRKRSPSSSEIYDIAGIKYKATI